MHSLGYGTNPLTPKNQQQQKNCQMDFLKELIERVYGQVAWKSSAQSCVNWNWGYVSQ